MGLLERDMFETSLEYKDRVLSLEEIFIGEITLEEYDADYEYFTVSLSVDNALINNLRTKLDDYEFKLYIQRDEAKNLYNISKIYKVHADVKSFDIKSKIITFYNFGFEGLDDFGWGFENYKLDYERKEDTIIFKGLEYKLIESPYTGRTWLDRNLGASIVSQNDYRDDEESFGDYYQWGRCSDGHEKLNSDLIDVCSRSTDTIHGDFIIIDTYDESHEPDWLTESNNGLWQGVHGINNPCPPGFRLPTIEEFEEEMIEFSKNNDDFLKNFLIAPLACDRSNFDGLYDNTTYSFQGIGIRGVLWTSSICNDKSYALSFDKDDGFLFDSDEIHKIEDSRATGIPIRCIKD